MASRRSILKKVRNGHKQQPTWMSDNIADPGRASRVRAEEVAAAVQAKADAAARAAVKALAAVKAKAAAEAKAAEATAAVAESKPKRRRSRRSEVVAED